MLTYFYTFSKSSIELIFFGSLLVTGSREHSTAKEYHYSANAQLSIPPISEPPYTETEAERLSCRQHKIG